MAEQVRAPFRHGTMCEMCGAIGPKAQFKHELTGRWLLWTCDCGYSWDTQTWADSQWPDDEITPILGPR